jgi:uncharacterized protein (DUF433 family)
VVESSKSSTSRRICTSSPPHATQFPPHERIKVNNKASSCDCPEQARSFKSQACVFISFYFRAASRLTSEERQKMIALASKLPEDGTGAKQIQDDFLTIDLSGFRREVDDRLDRLRAAQECVVSDPEILGGALVVRGTRVPVHHVAASVAAGASMERILAAYPSLNREQIELASLYAEANPQRGRPSQRLSLPPGAKLISSRTGTVPRPV